MDAKNPHSHPHSHPHLPLPPLSDHDHHRPLEHDLPVASRPPAWDPAYPFHHQFATNTINNTNYHHHHPPSSISPTTSPPQPSAPLSAPPHDIPPSSMVSDLHTENNVLQQSNPGESTLQDAGKTAVTKVRKSRKQGNAAQGRSTLFWVHNDPQSVAEGTREETLKLIRSHVMSEHNRKKRLENNKRYKTKAWKHLAYQPTETAESATAPASASASAAPESSRQASRKSSRKTAHSAPDPSSSAYESFSPEQQLKIEEQETSYEQDTGYEQETGYEQDTGYVQGTNLTDTGKYPLSANPADEYVPVKIESEALVAQDTSPWSYVGQGSNDPFNTVHTQLSDRMHRHLQHFLCKLTRLAYPLQRHYGAKLQAHWASLVQHDPASLHACICVAATNSALESGEFPLTDDKKRSSPLLLDTFHHRGETIRLVNEGLSDPIKAASDELIAAVSVLLTVEIATGDPDYLKIHLAGLRQMVGMRVSFADVADDVRFQISWTDIRVACMSLTKPIFPFVRYARPKNFTITPPSKELEATASSLISLIQIPGIFNDVMSEVIYDLAGLVWYAEWIKGGPEDQEFGEETECYYNTEVLYVEYALHNDRYTSTGEVKGDATIEGCVRLACLLFHNSAIWDFYPQIAPVFPKPIIALQMALKSTIRAGCYHLCRGLLIWLLFVGACSTRIPDQHTFFVNELASAIRLQGVRSWQELRAILFDYFYVDRCYLGPLRALWDELQTAPAPQHIV
ncbi:hypothetical protein BJX99DRAFT_230166 [Aspergillus californicus]